MNIRKVNMAKNEEKTCPLIATKDLVHLQRITSKYIIGIEEIGFRKPNGVLALSIFFHPKLTQYIALEK